MCGFLAVLQRSPVPASVFREALVTISHRGPDHTGVLFDSMHTSTGHVHAALGHCRLSILDPDPRSHQPFTDGQRHLLYNGEIYNFHDVRASRLKATSCHTAGDTEVVHRVMAAGNTELLHDFNGMWAACLFDAPQQRVICCRDRYGVKPLFYYHDDTMFAVASEAKAIFHFLGTKPSIRHEKIDSFLAAGMCYADARGETFFSDIREVRAGFSLEFDAATWRVTDRPWHDFDSARRQPCGDLRDVFENAVLSRLISDRPVGLLLSGGIDSSLILAVLIAHGRQDQVRCFIGQTGAAVSDDAHYARLCAERAGVEAIEVANTFGADAFDRILSMCWHHEKPFPLNGNSVAMHEMYAHISGYGVPVVIDGTGGDEVFGGYWGRYLPFALRDAIDAGDHHWVAELRQAALEDADVGRFVAGAFQRLHAPTPSRPSGLAGVYGRATVRTASSGDPLEGFSGSLADAMLIDSGSGRLAEWLWHNDRNAMAFGIENRSPFLDRSLIPMIGRGYADAFAAGWNKVSLRRLFSEFAPLPTQWRRQKQGFRWSCAAFLQANKPRILDLISQSPLVREHVDVDRFVSDAARDDAVYLGEFTGRLVSVAGFDAMFAGA